jgi:RNA:NAD 2'-phosphotransferase (TPT1/KptA family)
MRKALGRLLCYIHRHQPEAVTIDAGSYGYQVLKCTRCKILI